MDYLVTWEMEIHNANSPEEAAKRAREVQKDTSQPEPVMNVYSCDNDGECSRIDLEELEQVEIPHQ